MHDALFLVAAAAKAWLTCEGAESALGPSGARQLPVLEESGERQPDSGAPGLDCLRPHI